MDVIGVSNTRKLEHRQALLRPKMLFAPRAQLAALYEQVQE